MPSALAFAPSLLGLQHNMDLMYYDTLMSIDCDIPLDKNRGGGGLKNVFITRMESRFFIKNYNADGNIKICQNNLKTYFGSPSPLHRQLHGILVHALILDGFRSVG